MTRQSIHPGATLRKDLDALGMNAADRGPGEPHHRNPQRPARRAVRRRGALAAAAVTVGAWMLSGAASAGESYLRAGMGLDRPAGTTFTDRDCSSASPAIRMEVLVEYRPRLAFEGRANFLEPGRRQSVAAELSSLSGMLAGYVDLPGLGLAKIGPYVPLFVGAGVGAVRTRIGEMRMTFPKTTTVVPGAGRTGLAWMLTAGVAVVLGERATLDLAWRYTNLGEVRTGGGAGRVIWRDGSREPRPLDLAETRARLRSHGLRLSLRYGF